MKKHLVALGTVGTLAIPLSLAVSCGTGYGKQYDYYGNIQVITDAGSVKDKSFNQSAFEAVKDYTEIQDTSKKFGFSQPYRTSKVILQKAYLSALKHNVKTLVLPGFIHGADGDAMGFAKKYHDKYKDVKYISADGFADDQAWEHLLKPETDANDKAKYKLFNSKYQVEVFAKDDIKQKKFIDIKYFSKIKEVRNFVSTGNKKIKLNFGVGEYAVNKYLNFYNLSYASAESGFLAAVYGGLYFNVVKKVTSPIKAATFGGLPIPYGVTSFMDGYLQGIQWFNDNNNAAWQDINPIFLGGNKASKSDFTGSFDVGAATAKSTELINNGAQMILPVAGPQTGDVIGVIKSMNKSGDVFAFGVDTDQTKVYDSSLMLGSAVKGIYVSNSYALKVLNDSKTDNDHFSQFNLNLTSNVDRKPSEIFKNQFHEYVYGKADGPNDKKYDINDKNKLNDYGLMGKLMANGMSKLDANIRTLPTGFAPSASIKNDLTAEKIYKDAFEFAAKNNVVAGLSKDSGKETNSDKAFKNFGSFINVGFSV